jgi:hypothetical protein
MKPPKWLERLVWILLPPDYREPVLGDLQERYRSLAHYLLDTVSAVPAAIIGKIRRTTPFPALLREVVLIYASFFAAASVVDLFYGVGTSLQQIAATTAVGVAGLLAQSLYQPYTGKRLPLGFRTDVLDGLFLALAVAFLVETRWPHAELYLVGTFLGWILSAFLVSRLWDWMDSQRGGRFGGAR